MNGQRPDFTEKASLVIKLTLRTPSSKDNEMFLKTKNDLQATIRRLKKTDETHATSVAAKLPLNISVFKVIQVASHQVSYGVFHFAKILVGNEVYVHVRIHEYFDGNLQYHSIDTTRDTASWGKADPLVYFDF
ncbi:hypothetical protein BASA62_007027 [Batrachochytrium salamandrivorans]|nr:hypothetical protein BASA62_007027 [Batrachochytrium salamandrivorans]